MNPLYLSQLKIHDFRTFGKFEIDLPAQPGLTLVTGTNGLGKSSLFDAIEWGLTGEIRRFDSFLSSSKKKIAEGDYLTRRGAAADAHRVELGFSDGGRVARSVSETPDLAEVVALLTRGDWGPIRDVATYLAFTHFLGQAAQQRFTSRQAKEQWEALKGPSGIERLERIRKGLRGRSTQLAFTKRLETEKAAIQDLERQLGEWNGWRDRLARLQETLRSSNMLDADAFEATVIALAIDVTQHVGSGPSTTLSDSSGALAAIERVIAERKGLLPGWHATLDGLVTYPEEWAALSATADLQSPALESAKVLLDAARAVALKAEGTAAAARAQALEQAGRITSQEAHIAALETQRRDLARVAELDAASADVTFQIEQLDGQLSVAKVTLRHADERIAERTAAEAGRAQSRSLAASSREILALANSIADADAASLRAASEHRKALLAADSARDQLAQFSDEQAGLRLEQAALEMRLKSMRTETDAIAAAVAAIAGHLHDDDTDCPVCRTQFVPGNLRLLATAASTGSQARLTDAELQLQKLRDRIEQLTGEIVELDKVVAQEAVTRVAFEQSKVRLADLRNRVSAALETSTEGDLVALAATNERAAGVQLADAEAKCDAAIAAAAGTDTARLSLIADIASLGERRDSERARLGRLDAERLACRERLAGMSEPSDTQFIDGQLVQLRDQLNGLIEGRASEEQRINETTLAHEQALAQLRGAERALAEAQAARQAAITAVQTLEARWTAAGLLLPPTRAHLEDARASLAETQSTLNAFDQRREALTQAGAAAMLREELARLQETMNEASGGGDEPAAYASHLTDLLKQARAKHRLSTSARTALNKYTRSLQDEAEDFSSRVLAPLNDVIDAFNEAMLSTPGETINFKAGHRVDATQFDMTLRYKDRIDDATLNTGLPPQIVLSEGQLAANGFSILCAASTAYPWSRWRALLLDDPLQHNDIIHTAAFVDVMRNLVEFEGYQLIMSSHDRAETEFIARKFDAASLPCAKVVLTAPAADGVQYEDPIFNSAAQRGLRDRAAQASA
ncbi:AAA family ATPase [Novosphingobium sp.]|uniref:AAA family ATPase n=1 Tax=Novosphingobium sp. TaxID=1874826 RepID=UPI0025E9EED8|nr:AAA family ATPase [Novosphingobium sp.]